MEHLNNVILYLALILLLTKLFGIIFKKLGLPEVIGYLFAGLLLGGCIWRMFSGFNGIIDTNASSYETIKVFSEIGVILLLFTTGLEMDIDELKKVGVKATIIAIGGVIVPLVLGFAVAYPFLKDSYGVLSCVFVGTISTATSVGISVSVLKELKVLKGKVGTTIVSAAIIDDIIGVIILSILTSVASKEGSIGMTFLNIGLFFIVAIVLGLIIYFIGKKMVKKHPHNRRLSIFSISICLIYAYLAEEIFKVADITGAFIAGIICAITLKSFKENSDDQDPSVYVDKKVETSNYTFFEPIFFANIGLQITFKGLDASTILFATIFIIVAIFAKLVGCGAVAKLFGYSNAESMKIGVGMLARGEVALVVTIKGLGASLIPPSYLAVTVILILVTSIISPIILKKLYNTNPELINNEEIVLKNDIYI